MSNLLQTVSYVSVLSLFAASGGFCAQPVILDFEGLPGMGSVAGPVVPESAKLSYHFQATHGVRFRSESTSDYVAVVQLGMGHAASGINAIASVDNSGRLSYAPGIRIEFFAPRAPWIKATTDSVSIRGDRFGDGQAIFMEAFDVNGNRIAITAGLDVDPVALGIDTPGIHSVIVRAESPNVGWDDLTFNPLQSALPPNLLRIHRAVELEFDTVAGTTYRLEGSSHLRDWIPVGEQIEGTGFPYNTFVSTRGTDLRYFRLAKLDTSIGLVAYYPFEGTAADFSTNENHGVASNVTLVTNRFGRGDSAYRFRGEIDSFIGVPDSPSLDITDQITLAAWINFEAGGPFAARTINKGVYSTGSSPASSANRYMDSTLKSDTNPEFHLQTPTRLLQAGQWYLTVTTYDGSIMRSYVDGVLVAEDQDTLVIRTNDLDLNIGRNTENGSDHYRGVIDDVRIYNRALAVAEILTLLNAPDTFSENSL